MSLTAAEWRYAAQRAREGAPLTWEATGNKNGPCVAISVSARRGNIALNKIAEMRAYGLSMLSDPTYYEFLCALPNYSEIYQEINKLSPCHDRSIWILLMERKAAALEEHDVPSTLPSEPELMTVGG